MAPSFNLIGTVPIHWIYSLQIQNTNYDSLNDAPILATSILNARESLLYIFTGIFFQMRLRIPNLLLVTVSPCVSRLG